ncbi:hypothetical protein [Gemmatimonas sp.]|uniref:hypothetical protein n=1 Tax=Gemmatimonas sp. TaxID=1962908 RepID=UPI00286DA212|nr:hypothetical protein [Gemmatimonas sp.]
MHRAFIDGLPTGRACVHRSGAGGATGSYSTNPSHPNWDVSPDGSEFLMLRHAGEEVQVILVQNWGREVAARTAAIRAK